MKYIKRELENKFLRMNAFFKAILLLGARQVGKSTMLKHLAKEQERTIVTMDDDMVRELARNDPRLFFQTYKPPIMIDEIQKAPELLEHIKIICDESEERGLFWLTGSQRNKLMEKAQDSLAGRLGILHLYGLSQREKEGYIDPPELDFSFDAILNRSKLMGENDINDVFTGIWRGGFVDVQEATVEEANVYYQSYIDNYLVSDAVNDVGIKETDAFKRLIRACAAMTGNLVNYNTLAEIAGVSAVTAKTWVNVLRDMDVLYLLEPYANNKIKRLVKTPKLYFADTGLCAYLTRWPTSETLRDGAAGGHFYENHVVMELLKNYSYAENGADISFYRDSKAKEIDLFVESGGKIHPLEIKMSAHPDVRVTNKYKVIENSGLEQGNGGIICMVAKPMPIDEKNTFIPSNII